MALPDPGPDGLSNLREDGRSQDHYDPSHDPEKQGEGRWHGRTEDEVARHSADDAGPWHGGYLQAALEP